MSHPTAHNPLLDNVRTDSEPLDGPRCGRETRHIPPILGSCSKAEVEEYNVDDEGEVQGNEPQPVAQPDDPDDDGGDGEDEEEDDDDDDEEEEEGGIEEVEEEQSGDVPCISLITDAESVQDSTAPLHLTTPQDGKKRKRRIELEEDTDAKFRHLVEKTLEKIESDRVKLETMLYDQVTTFVDMMKTAFTKNDCAS